jgi:hypothetical protein
VLRAKGRALRLLRRLKSFSAKALVVTTEPGGDVIRTSPRIRVKR